MREKLYIKHYMPLLKVYRINKQDIFMLITFWE